MNEKFLKLYYEKYGQSSGKTYDAWLADIKRDPTNKLDQMATYLESDPDRLQDFDYNLHYSDGELYMPIEVYKNAIGVANNDPITTKAYNEKTKRNIGAYIHRIYNDITSPESDGATQPEPIPVENTEPIADTGSEVTTDSQDGGEGSIIDDNSGITPAKKVVDYKSLADPSKNFYTSAETEIINKRKGLETKKTVEKSRNESFKEKASNELAAVIPDNGPQNNDNEQNIDEDQSNAKTPENVAKIDYRYVKESIASVERDIKIKDPYKSFNKDTNALGKYQIVPSQHKEDVLDVTGIDISTYEGKKSFINNPDAQEKYMDFLMERYANNLSDLQIVNKANGAQYTDEELMYLNHWQGFEGAKDSIRTKQTANPENNVELFTQLERYKKNVEENIKKYPKLKYEDIAVEIDGDPTDGAVPEKGTGPFDNLPILDERQKEIIDSNNKSIDFYNKVIEKNKKTLSKKNTTLSESALLEVRKKNADYETIVRDLSEQNSSILDNKSTPNNEQWTPEGYKNELDFRINAVDNAQAMLSVSTDDKDISYYSKKTKQARESLKKLYENSPQELQNKGYVEDIVSDIETNKRTLGDVFRDNYDVLATVTPPEYQKALSLYKDIQVEQSEIDFQKRHGLDKTPIGLERIAQAKTNILNLQTDLNKSVYSAKESKLLAVRTAEGEYRKALKTNDPNIISQARTKLNNAEEAVGKLVNSVDQSSGTVKTIQAELAEWEKQGKFRGITNNEDKLKIYLLGVSEEYAKISKLSNVGLGEMIANDLGYQDNPVYKRWQELYGKLETLTVPFLFNKDTVTGQDNDLIKLFFRGVATLPMLDKIGKERTSETISSLEGVEVPAIGSIKKSAKEQLAGDEGWLPSIESTVETVGSSAGFAAELFAGNAAMRMASIVPKAGKVLRGLDELAETGKIGGSTLFKSELASKVFGNALQSGLSYKATGLVLPKSQEELNGFGGAAAGAGEVLGEAVYEKVVGGALAAIFGPNAQKASNVLTKMVKKIGKGVGEVASEYLETIATLADENGFNQEFLNDLDAQFPDIKANTRFVVSTFMMGAIMGEGHDAGKALGQAVQEQAEKLAPDQKRIFDEAKRKVEQAKIEAQSELATEPVTDPTTEPVTEADSAPVVGSDSEPVVDSAPVAGPDSEPVVDSAPVPDPVTNPGTEPVIELSPVTNIASNVLAAMELGETVTVIEGNVPLEKPIDQEVITAQIAELKVLAENELLSREDFDKTIIATSSNKQEADNLWEAIETNPLEALTKLEEEIISQQKTKDNGPEQGTTEDTTANNTTTNHKLTATSKLGNTETKQETPNNGNTQLSKASDIRIESDGNNVPATKESIQAKYPDAKVVNSVSDLPQNLQDEIAQNSSDGEVVYGLVDHTTGDIYIISDNVQTMDVADATYRHEFLGHKGVIAKLGEKLDGYAITLVDNATGEQREKIEVLSQLYFKKPINELTGNEKSLLGQEYIAFISEDSENNQSVFNRIANKIREFMRELGLPLSISDSEVKELINSIERDIESSKKKLPTANQQALEFIKSLSKKDLVELLYLSGNESINPSLVNYFNKNYDRWIKGVKVPTELIPTFKSYKSSRNRGGNILNRKISENERPSIRTTEVRSQESKGATQARRGKKGPQKEQGGERPIQKQYEKQVVEATEILSNRLGVNHWVSQLFTKAMDSIINTRITTPIPTQVASYVSDNELLPHIAKIAEQAAIVSDGYDNTPSEAVMMVSRAHARAQAVDGTIPDPKLNIKGKRTAGEQITKPLLALIKKSFPGINVKIVSGLDAVAKMGTNSKAYKNVTGKIIGYFGEDGTIYLDDTEADQETLIEEYAHLWIALAKAYKGELYQSILEQAKASPEFVALSSDPDYGHFGEDTRAEEIFAKLVASQIVKDGKVITPSSAAKFWNLIKSFLSKLFQTNFSSDLFIQKMSLMDLAKAAGKELTGGIAISQIKSTDVHKLQNNLAMSAAISPALYDMIDRGMLQKEKAILLGVESPFITKAYQYIEQKVFPKYSMGEVMNRLTKLKASKAKAAIFKANANSIKVKKSLHAYFVAKYGKQYSTTNSKQVARELSLFNRFLGGPDKISESELDNLLKMAIPMLGPGPTFLGEYTQLKADILDMRSRIDTLSNKLIEEGLIYKDGLVVQLNPDLNTIIQSSYEYYDFIESSKILLDKEYEKNRVKIAMMDDTQLKEEIERLLDERARGKAEITFNKLRELDFSIKFIKMTNMINVLGLSMTKESLIAKLEELKGAYKSPNEKTRKAAASAFNSWAKSKFAILNNQADLARAAVTLSPAEIDLLNDIDLLMQQLEDDGSTGFNLRAYALKLNSDVSKLKKTNLKFNEKVKYVKGIAWNKNVDGTYQIGFIHGDASKQYANNVTVEQLGTIFGKDMVDYIVAREKGIRMYKKERSISSHAMFHKIRQNIGMYVTRSYAKYDNKARAKEALMAQPSSLIGKARSIIIKSLTRNRDIVSLEIIPDPSAPYTLNRLDQGYLVRFKNKYGLWSEWQKTTLRDLGEKTNTSGIINASDIASINGYLNTKNRLVYNLRYKAIGGKEITFPLSVERQEELLIQLLENEKADSQQQQASEDKLRVNVKEFWKRKDLSKAFRVLIGEYKDPYINSLKTLTKMEAALAHLEWENQILAEHGSRGFRKEDNPPKNTKKWKPLTREMSAGLFDQGYRWVEQSVWYSYYQENSLAHLNGVMGMLARLAAYASGVLALTSPKSQNRNFLSGIFIALRNGMISYKDIASAKDAMIISGAETEPGNFMWLSPLFNILRKLIGGNKYGIAQEGFNAKNPLISDRDKLIEVFAILKEENLLDGSVDSGLFLDYINSKDDQNIFELMLEKASLVNQSADNFWKVLGFLKEYRTYRKAYPGLSNQEVIRKAAQITRDTWPVYGELPDWVKDWSSKIPFFGQFVMYKSAIIQNYARTFNIIKEEMASGIPALRGRARQRIFGLTADIAFKKLLYTSGISVLGWLLGGDDDDDDEKKAIAMLDRMYDAGDIGILEYMNKRYIDGPKNAGFMGLEKPYNANKDYVLLNVSKESVTYLDLSYVDPSSYLISIFNSYLRKENQPGLNVLLDELLNSYTDEKYLYKLTREAMNGETEFGDRIYDVNDAGAIKAFKSITHISGSMVPLIIYDITTIGKGLLGMAAPSGDQIVLSDELVSMFIGLKVKTKSPIRMIRGNFYESANTLKDQAFALKQGILTQKKNKGTIPDILAPAVNVVLPDTYIKNLSIPEQKKIRKEYALREVAKLQGWVKDMYTLGFTRYDIEQAVDDIRFPSEDAFNIDFKNEIFK